MQHSARVVRHAKKHMASDRVHFARAVPCQVLAKWRADAGRLLTLEAAKAQIVDKHKDIVRQAHEFLTKCACLDRHCRGALQCVLAALSSP